MEKWRREVQLLILAVPLDFCHMCVYMYMCVEGQRSTLSIFISHSPPYVLRQGLSLNREQIFCIDWLPTSSKDPPALACETLGLLTRAPLYLVCILVFEDQLDPHVYMSSTVVPKPSPQVYIWMAFRCSRPINVSITWKHLSYFVPSANKSIVINRLSISLADKAALGGWGMWNWTAPDLQNQASFSISKA